MQKDFAVSFLLVLLAAKQFGINSSVILYRRGGPPGARLQLRCVPEPSIVDAEEGFVASIPSFSPSVGAMVARPGRVRKDWVQHAVMDTTETVLRKAATRFIQNEGLRVSTLAPSTRLTRSALSASCNQCEACTSSWFFFSFDSDGRLIVEKSGACDGAKNLDRIRLQNARKYGKTTTPGKALAAMERDNVPVDQRPSTKQLENQRPNKDMPPVGPSIYPALCIGALDQFLKNLPEHVHVWHDHVVNTAGRICIPFTSVAMSEFAKATTLPSMLMNFTFQTNERGLLLGAVGPVGLNIAGAYPSMRFMPVVFILANAEDESAQRAGIRVFLNERTEGPAVSDGFFDHSCLLGAHAEVGDRVFLHRCLQHVKSDVKKEASKKDPASGQHRLKRSELLTDLISWIEFSAWLPSDLEFHTFWSHLLTRMKNCEEPTDFNEPAMAKYLAECIFDGSGPLLRSAWSTGLGLVPLGFTTYAPNAIESSHRVLKGLLPCPRSLDVASLMAEVCTVVDIRLKGGTWSNLLSAVPEPPPALYKKKQPKLSKKLGAEDDSRCRRLDLDKILQHYRQHGAQKTSIAQHCPVELSDGTRAVTVYVMPKYCLDLAEKNPGDMMSMLGIATATSVAEIEAACASKDTNTYDYRRHMNLRQAYVAVYVAVDGTVVDTHKDFVDCAGHTEHQLFIKGLLSKTEAGKAWIAPIAFGPKSSRPGKRKRRPLPKRSEDLKRMLRPPGSARPHASPIPLALLDGKPSDPAAVNSCVLPLALQDVLQDAMPAVLPCSQRSKRMWWKAIQGPLRDALRRAADKQVMDEVIRQSLETYTQGKRTLAEARLRVANRLRPLGLERVDTDPFGNCQFIAVCRSACLPYDHAVLRGRVCDYLAKFADVFRSFFVGQFAVYEDYVANMRLDATWGDHLTLIAMSHVLLQPLHVVTDSVEELASLIIIEPPEHVDRESWTTQHPIVVCHYGEVHYESVRPSSADHAASSGEASEAKCTKMEPGIKVEAAAEDDLDGRQPREYMNHMVPFFGSANGIYIYIDVQRCRFVAVHDSPDPRLRDLDNAPAVYKQASRTVKWGTAKHPAPLSALSVCVEWLWMKQLHVSGGDEAMPEAVTQYIYSGAWEILLPASARM